MYSADAETGLPTQNCSNKHEEHLKVLGLSGNCHSKDDYQDDQHGDGHASDTGDDY